MSGGKSGERISLKSSFGVRERGRSDMAARTKALAEIGHLGCT
jgi:hypothetical protein